MANITHHWKAWLKPNRFTPDDDKDFVAIPLAADRTLHNEDVARLIVAARSELQYETILAVLNQRDSIVHGKLKECFTFQDKVVHIRPSIPGVWHGANAKYDAATHGPRITVSETAETREILSQIGVTILGVKGDGAYIAIVTDVATGKTDGTITVGDDIIIEGEKIKIAPIDEDGLGVFFQSLTTSMTYMATHRFSVNDPSKIIVRVPEDLPVDSYILHVITRFSQGHVLLNAPRDITYDTYLSVKP
jgi:hypothetical protein